MSEKTKKTAMIITVNNTLEHNTTIVYRSIFLGETYSLIESIPNWDVICIDSKIENITLTDFIKLFLEKPEVVIFWSDVHQSQSIINLAKRLKIISENTKIMVFGRSTTFIPQFFERDPFDFIHVSGDREASIIDVISYIDGRISEEEISGISYCKNGKYFRNNGRLLDQEKWPFPKLSILPIDKYKDYTSSIHGPRYSHRISVTVAKGCSWGCSYCGATEEEGKSDRRRSISEIYNWIDRENINKYECYLHLYAPDLFYDKKWIQSFNEEYSNRNSNFSWRGVTTTKTLQDKNLIFDCGRNGCKELAIGIEHINHKKLRPVKSTLDEIKIASENCHEAGIDLKGLVMLGYPGQIEDDVVFISDFLKSLGVTIRFTGYTPLQNLKFLTQKELDSISIEQYDRRTFFDPNKSKLDKNFFYKTISKDDGYIYA